MHHCYKKITVELQILWVMGLASLMPLISLHNVRVSLDLFLFTNNHILFQLRMTK